MKKRKILVVDDDEYIRDAFQEAFILEGYDVQAAGSAEEALEIMKAEIIPVLFLDLKLPGMNGIELCQILKKKYPTIVIHAVTGYASVFELADCREAGFDDYFLKPVKLSVLSKAAKHAFEMLDRWSGK